MKTNRPFKLIVTAQADITKPAVIAIRGVIGSFYDENWNVKTTEDEVLNELAAIPETQQVRAEINSVGGAVGITLGIYNAFEKRGNITTVNTGYACSSASLLMLAGKTRISPTASIWMIHRAMGGAYGNVDDVASALEMMKVHDDMIVQIYAKKTGQSVEAIKEMMRKETWFTGAEALKLGFCTSNEGDADLSVDNVSADAAAKSKYKVPENLRERFAVRAQATAELQEPPKQDSDETKKMKNIIEALVAAGHKSLTANSTEGEVLTVINTLLTEHKDATAANKANVEARKTRVEALVTKAIEDKVVDAKRKDSLVRQGTASAEAENDLVENLSELRTAVSASAPKKPRTTTPAAVVENEGEAGSTEEQIKEVQAKIAEATDGAEKGKLTNQLLVLRGLKKKD